MRKLNKQRRADRRASTKGKGEKACSSEEQTVCFPRRIPCMEAHTLTSMEYRISTRVTFRPLPRCISSSSHHLAAIFIFMGVAFGCHSRHLYDATRLRGLNAQRRDRDGLRPCKCDVKYRALSHHFRYAFMQSLTAYSQFPFNVYKVSVPPFVSLRVRAKFHSGRNA